MGNEQSIHDLSELKLVGLTPEDSHRRLEEVCEKLNKYLREYPDYLKQMMPKNWASGINIDFRDCLKRNHLCVIYVDLKLSNENHYHLVNQAGMLFIKQQKCPPLNIVEKKFVYEDNTLNITAVIGDICAWILSKNLFHNFSINSDNLKTSVVYAIEKLAPALETSETFEESGKVHFCEPLVAPDSSVAWFKVSIVYSSKIESDWLGSYKKTTFELECYNFHFKTFDDFKAAYIYALSQDN